MKIKEYSLEVTIGLPDFSNIKPNITLTDVGSFEEAHAEATKYLDSIWKGTPNAKIDSPFGKSGASNSFKQVECLVGGSILYDEVNHIYTNDAGDVYLSGSKYAAQFGKVFAKEAIAEKMAIKSGVPADEILEIWKMGGQASMSFGTAIHEAMEMYGKFTKTCKVLEKEYHMSNIPMVKQIVADFFKGREQENALYEPMIVDHKRKWAGQVDRLLIVDEAKKICRIQDYKTNGELKPDKLEEYWHQLSFYGSIMQAHGWTVDGLDIHHWSTVWKTYSNEMKEIK